MKTRKFLVVLTPDEEQPEILNVTVPELPGCLTWGFGRKEALRHAREVIELFLEAMHDNGVDSEKPEMAEIEVAA